MAHPLPIITTLAFLQLWTCGNQSLAGFIGSIFAEVLDEAGCEILSLLLPDAGLCVCVARIEDGGIHVGQCCGNLEVEVRNLLGGSLQDAAVENSVDDTTCIRDR